MYDFVAEDSDFSFLLPTHVPIDVSGAPDARAAAAEGLDKIRAGARLDVLGMYKGQTIFLRMPPSAFHFW